MEATTTITSKLEMIVTEQSAEQIPEPYHGMKVSEDDYWAFYYDYPDRCFEWCEGKLEELGVSDLLTLRVYKWFLFLLQAYLDSFPVAEIINLETGFRLRNRSIRKPDLGVIHQDNPVQMKGLDKSYSGIFDMCIEALSDSTPEDEERDTIRKYQEYAAAMVKEYYILHDSLARCAFYRLGINKKYVPIDDSDGIIRSTVLPGFQFRLMDLVKKPPLIKLIHDPAYQHFVMLDYQKALREKNEAVQEKDAVVQEKNEAVQEKDAAILREQAAVLKAEYERQRAEAAEAELARLKALLVK